MEDLISQKYSKLQYSYRIRHKLSPKCTWNSLKVGSLTQNDNFNFIYFVASLAFTRIPDGCPSLLHGKIPFRLHFLESWCSGWVTLTSGWAISGWPLQVGHFRLGHFRLSFGHFRLGPLQVGHFRLGPFQVGAISGWGHFRLGHFRLRYAYFRLGPLQVGDFRLGRFQVGAISGCAISGWAISGCV